eukprot:scaffold818_cov64-Phaeocystis_antarctica.AAC.15
MSRRTAANSRCRTTRLSPLADGEHVGRGVRLCHPRRGAGPPPWAPRIGPWPVGEGAAVASLRFGRQHASLAARNSTSESSPARKGPVPLFLPLLQFGLTVGARLDPTGGGPPIGRGSGQRKIHAAITEAASGPTRCRGGRVRLDDWYDLCVPPRWLWCTPVVPVAGVGVLSCPEFN